MIKFLAAVESMGFYSAEEFRGSNWVHDFRKATWFDTLEEAQKVSAEYYLRAEINVHTNPNHSASPLIEHSLGKYRSHCRYCNKAYGRGQYTRIRAMQRYASEVHGKCEIITLLSLQNAMQPSVAESLVKYRRPKVV